LVHGTSKDPGDEDAMYDQLFFLGKENKVQKAGFWRDWHSLLMGK
jgi:hypothetical protein